MRPLKRNLEIWGRIYGEKRSKMFNRPLILMLLCFTGGIIFSHEIISSSPAFSLPLFTTMVFCLFFTLFFSWRIRFFFLLLVFFNTGILLDIQKKPSFQLTPFSVKHKKVTIEGTVLEPPKIIKNMARLKVRAHRLFSGDKSLFINEDLMVTIYRHVPRLRPGDKIRFHARLKSFKNFNNPGRYDYETSMRLMGIACSASISDGRYIVPMGKGRLPFFRDFLEKIQRPVRLFLRTRLNTGDYALYRALILGERQGIGNELRESFNRTGLGHILAVSGLHIGLVACIAFWFFKWILSCSYTLALKIDTRKLAAFLTCFPVIGYTCLAGCQVSSQRAMIMALVYFWSLILGREKEFWSTLALAAFIILAIDPHAIYSISFQLSFSAVIGIISLAPLVTDVIMKPGENFREIKTLFKKIYVYMAGLVAVSFSAMLFLLPIIAFYFHRISLVSVPANVTVMPVLGLWVIPLGLLSVIALPFSCQLSGFLLHLGSWGLHGMMKIIEFWSSLPWAGLWVITPGFLEICLFYGLIFFIFFYRRLPWARAGVLIVAVLIIADAGYWIFRTNFNKELRVTFLDVGKGNAAFVEFPMGKRMLIDGGGFSNNRFNVGKMVVAPFLRHSKITKIDYLVLIHSRSDHMNGLCFIVSTFHPKEIWYNGDHVDTTSFKKLMAIIEANRIKKLFPAGLKDAREINGVRVEILRPESGACSLPIDDSGSSLNNHSLALKISYEGKSFLFPGGLEFPGEKLLVSNVGHSLKSDILLSPRHGSRSSSSREFSGVINPNICVISSGEGNFFGFFHQQTLKRLRDTGCGIIRVDQAGAVQFKVGHGRIEINRFCENKGF